MQFDFSGNEINLADDLQGLKVAFQSIRDWASTAEGIEAPADAPQFANPFFWPKIESIPGLPLPSIQSATLATKGFYAVRLTGVQTEGPRTFPAAYFGVVRTLELVPGIRMHIDDETKLDHPDGGTYRIILDVPKIKGLRQIRTSLGRILFDVPQDAKLHERRTKSHRVISPGSFVLTKFRPKTPPPTRVDVLQSAGWLVERMAGYLPYGPDEIHNLLASLFETADRWHWDELLDRSNHEKPKHWR